MKHKRHHGKLFFINPQIWPGQVTQTDAGQWTYSTYNPVIGAFVESKKYYSKKHIASSEMARYVREENAKRKKWRKRQK